MTPPPKVLLCLFSLFSLLFQFHLVSLDAMYFCLPPLVSWCPPLFAPLMCLQADSMLPSQGTLFPHFSTQLSSDGLFAKLFPPVSLGCSSVSSYTSWLSIMESWIVLNPSSLLHFLSIFLFCCHPSFLHFYYLSPRLSSHFSTIRDGLKLHRSPLASWVVERWVGTYYCLFLWSVFSSPLLGGNYTSASVSFFPMAHPELSDGSQLLSYPFLLVSCNIYLDPHLSVTHETKICSGR